LCKYLPCPPCSHHCSEYMKDHKPEIHDGDAYWKFVFEFHNFVNKRTSKYELTDEEAVSHTEQYLKLHYKKYTELLQIEYDESTLDMDTVIDSTFCMEDIWVSLAWTTRVMTYSVSGEANSEEQIRYYQFLRTLPQILPFRGVLLKNPKSDGTIRTMGELIESLLKDDDFVDFSNRDHSSHTLDRILHELCVDIDPKFFPRVSISSRVEPLYAPDVMRAKHHNDRRVEDSKKIQAMQKVIDSLQTEDGKRNMSSEEGESWQTVSFILIGILILSMTVFVTWWIMMRRKFGPSFWYNPVLQEVPPSVFNVRET
jgi:hypothetical protein